MSNLAFLETPLAIDDTARLGHARVCCVSSPSVEVELEDGTRTTALLAMPIPYEPAIDDVLLTVRSGRGCYAIGVLQGKGRTNLTFDGDVELGSRNGKVRIRAAEDIALDAPQVAVRAQRFVAVADSVLQRFRTMRQKVTDLKSVFAGRSHTVVENGAYQQSKSATILTEEKVHVNGKSIHLG